MINLLSHSIDRELEIEQISVCTDKIVCQKFISNIISFLKAHFGYLENSEYSDQPASSKAG